MACGEPRRRMGDSLRFLVYLQCVVIAEIDGDLFLVLTINETSFMKKFLSITLLLTAMFLTFSACSSDDETSSLSGTKWVAKFADKDYIVLNFTSNSNVEGSFTDSNLVIDGKLSTGNYSTKDNQVTFSNFVIKYFGIAEYRFEKAEISGSAMTVSYYWKYNTSSDWGSVYTKTFSMK